MHGPRRALQPMIKTALNTISTHLLHICDTNSGAVREKIYNRTVSSGHPPQYIIVWYRFCPVCSMRGLLITFG